MRLFPPGRDARRSRPLTLATFATFATSLLALAVTVALAGVAFGARLGGLSSSLTAQSPPVPGDPLAGVSPREFEEFRIGLEDFREIEESAEGLGPLFNGTGCASCHSVPTIGGGSPMTELRMGTRDADGRFRELSGGSLFQLFSIPDHRCQPAAGHLTCSVLWAGDACG